MKAAAAFLDFLFPPMCCLCREKTVHLLCRSCLEMLAPPDPAFRCRHCFQEAAESKLCRQCANVVALDAPRAYLFEASPIAAAWRRLLLQEGDGALCQIAASLFIYQWGRLNWPLPDRIATVPSPDKINPLYSIAQEVAKMLGKPLKKELKLEWVGPFQWHLKRSGRDLLENQSLLLIDFGSRDDWLKKALGELWPAYPRQIYILSFFEILEEKSKGC